MRAIAADLVEIGYQRISLAGQLGFEAIDLEVVQVDLQRLGPAIDVEADAGGDARAVVSRDDMVPATRLANVKS